MCPPRWTPSSRFRHSGAVARLVHKPLLAACLSRKSPSHITPLRKFHPSDANSDEHLPKRSRQATGFRCRWRSAIALRRLRLLVLRISLELSIHTGPLTTAMELGMEILQRRVEGLGPAMISSSPVANPGQNLMSHFFLGPLPPPPSNSMLERMTQR